MASKDVETKVVQVRFDNQKFEKNIKATIKSTKELDNSLKFKDSKKGIDELSKSLEKLDTSEISKNVKDIDKETHKISLSFKELFKIKVLSRIIDNITNSTINMLKSMTGINNIKAGWDAYNESLTTTGGILNQVQRDGYGLEDVTDALEKLRWYADETSYSFQTMSDGIRQFTIAGIDLEAATSAVQGVANLAGSAKVFDTFKVQSAMDAISKSMQTGYMDTLKWTTLTNTAGIVTKDFSEKLLEAAAAQGTLIKSASGQYKTKKSGKLVTTENIRSTLADRWITSDVMTRVLGEYNSATEVVKGFMTAIEDGGEEAFKSVSKDFPKIGKEFSSFDEMISYINNNVDQFGGEDGEIVKMTKNMNANNITTRQAAKLMKELGYEFDEVSYKAFMSSQETTSFSQAVSYVATAIKTSWQGIFQAMFGDVEKSTNLWSDVSDKFYGIFVAPFNALESQFDKWQEFEEGGGEDFRQAILNIIDALGEFAEVVKETFNKVLGDDLTNVLKNITLWLKNFSEGLKENEDVKNILKAVSTILANIFKIFLRIGKSAVKIIGSILTAAQPIFSGIAEIILLLAEGFEWLVNFIEETGLLQTIVLAVVKIIEAIGQAIKKVAKAFQNSRGMLTFATLLQLAFEGILFAITKIIDGIAIVLEWVAGLFGTVGEDVDDKTDKVNFFAEAIDNLRKFFEKLATPFKMIITFFKTMDFKSALSASIGAIAAFGIAVKNVFVGAFNKIISLFTNGKISEFFGALGEKLKPFVDFIKDLIWLIVKPLVDAVKTYNLGKVVAWFGALLGIILLIKFIYDQMAIMHGYKKVLSSIADMFWALEARFKASFVRSWGALILSIGVLIFIIASVLGKIAGLVKEYKPGEIIASIFILAGVLIATAGLFAIVAITSKYAKGSMRGGFALIGFSLALSLALSAIKKIADITKDLNLFDVWKAVAIFGAISVIFGTVMMMSRIGITTPLILSFIKVILSIRAMLGISLWFFKQLSTVEDKDIYNGIAVIRAMTIAFSAIMIISRVGAITSAKAKLTSFIDVGNVILSMAMLLATFSILLNTVRGSTWSDIGKVGAIFGSIFIVTKNIVAMSIVASLIPVPMVEKGFIKIGGIMAAISFTALSAMLALKIAGTMRPEVMQTGLRRIILLYAVIGAIAAVLLGINKIGLKNSTLASNEFKMDWKSGFSSSRSPKKGNGIASILFAIAITSLAATAVMYLLAGMDPSAYWKGFVRFLRLFGIIAGTAAILILLSKIKTKGATGRTIRLTGTIIVIIGLLITIVYALSELSSITDQNALISARNTIMFIMLTIAGVIAILAIVSKIAGVKILLGALSMVLIIGSIVGAFAIVVAVLNHSKTSIMEFAEAFKTIFDTFASMSWSQMIAMASAFAIIVGTIVAAISVLAIISSTGVGALGILVGVAALIALLYALVGAFAILVAVMNHSKTDIKSFAEAFSIIVTSISDGTVSIINALGNLAEKITGGITNILHEVKEIFSTLGDSIHQNFEDIKSMIDFLKDTDENDINKLRTLARNISELAGAFAVQGVESLGKSIIGLFGVDTDRTKGISAIIGVLDDLDPSKLSNLTLLIDTIKTLPDIMKNFDKELEPYKNSLSDMVAYLLNLGMVYDMHKETFDKIKDMIGIITNSANNPISYSIAIRYIESLIQLLNSDINIEPKITPMFDFTNFDSGLNYMRNSFAGMGTYYSAQRANNEYNQAVQYRNARDQNISPSAVAGVPGMSINVTQNFTDAMMYSYQVNRAMQNTVQDVIGGVKSGAALFKSHLGKPR